MAKNKQVILLIQENSPSPIGGIERHCYNIAELFKSDDDVEIKILFKDLISHTRIKKIDKILFSFKELKKKISESEASSVHIHGFASLVVFQAIIAANLLKKRIVYTPHFHPFHTLDNPLLGKIFFFLLLKPILQMIDTIICINSEDFSFFTKYHKKVTIIPNWLNNMPTSDEVNIGKSTQKQNMILFVGRADNNKGIDHLAKINPDIYDIHCVTKGSINKRFVYHSSVSDEALSKLYFMATLVVIPSRYEAFSYVALEALAHGTQILVSNRVRILDHLTENNAFVHKFQYGDYNGFLEKIDTIMSSENNPDINSALPEIMLIFEKGKIREALKRTYGNSEYVSI